MSRLKKIMSGLFRPAGSAKPMTSRMRRDATRYVVLQTDHGPFVVNKNDTIIGRSLSHTGTYEKTEVEILARLAEARLAREEKITIIDAGANIGVHSIALARRFGEKARIIAIEAQDEMFRLLCANTRLSRADNVECINAAVSDSADSSIRFQAPDYDSLNNFGGLELMPPEVSDNADMVRCDWESVRTMTIDGLGIDVDLIKLDIEGMEMRALAGASGTIARSRPVVFCEMTKGEAGEINRFFDQLRYRAIALNQNVIFAPTEEPLPL